jgi:hypothetical protein
MSYPKGTLLRSYNTDDNTKHYTAVIINDGKVLEIKNINDNKRTTFNSVEEWCQTRNISQESLQVDESKIQPYNQEKQTDNADGIYVRNNGYLMYYNKGKCQPCWCEWNNWCYNTIVKYAPDLLDNNELKGLYNNMINTSTKYRDIYLSIVRVSKNKMFKIINRSNFQHYKNYDMDMSRLNDAQQLIMKYYTQIVDIIKPHIEKQLEHAYEVKTIKQQTASLNRGITYGETKIIKLQKYIDNAKKEKIEMENKLAEYQKK